ncbi:hypothetical protein RRK63_004780 [Vibrio fluvialis]|nr:hypothetical protein [Vibrio fluvialis]ELI5736003.1 hypothetical protein [Vibrio fluvialis]
MFKRLFKFTLLVLALVSAGVLWQQAQLSVLALGRIDPLPETRHMLAEQRYADAASYLGFFMDYDYVRDNPKAQALYADITRIRSDWRYQFDKLSEGLLTGTSDESIGQVAAVTTDFLVIGDIRDLTRQGMNHLQGEAVDETLVALSALGLVATTAQIVSGIGTVETAGVAAPTLVATTATKSGLVALKTAKRLGKLPPWLGKSLVREAKIAQQSKSLSAMTEMLSDVTTLANTRGGFRLLSRTKNSAELSRMAAFARAFGSQSATLYHLGGDAVVAMTPRAAQLGKESIKLAATFGQGGLRLLDNFGALKFTKLAVRGAKIAYKGDAIALLAKWLLMLPVWGLYAVMGLAAVVWFPRRWMRRS